MSEISLIKNLFDDNDEYEAGLLCTYSLNLNFLEQYLLNLQALQFCDSLSIFTDASVYDSFIEDTPKWLNKKYLVTSIPARGIFHSKIYLLASEKKALFAIGSANLTRESLTSNLELLSLFEVTKVNTTYSSLLFEVLSYFNSLAQISGSQTAQEKVSYVEELCAHFVHPRENEKLHFIHNTERSILDGITERFHGEIPSSIQIVSPFYDAGLAVVNALKTLFPAAAIEIIVQQGKSNFPKDKFNDFDKDFEVLVYKDIDRYIHGKSFLFHFANKTLLYMGSANCTRAAFLERVDRGNFEVGLIGEIDDTAKSLLLSPYGVQPEVLDSIDDLMVSETTDELIHKRSGAIDVLLQAEKKGDTIVVALREDRDSKFTPKILIAANAETEVSFPLTTAVQAEVVLSHEKDLKGIKEPFLIKMEGQDSNGNTVQTNSVWVINLQESAGDSQKKKYRKLYTNPFELAEFILFLMGQEDGEELTKFLLTFDVPLDLLLPPHFYKKRWESEGNVEGALSQSKLFFPVGEDKLDLYRNFLERLLKKLEKHRENPQKDSVSNFIYILSMLFSMIEFLDTAKFAEYKDKKVLTREEWFSIRQYYNMFLSYIESSWSMLWQINGYADQISGQLALESDELSDPKISNFEEYIIQNEYFDTIKILSNIASKTLANFMTLQKEKVVDVGENVHILPKIFEKDIHLLQIGEIENSLLITMKRLTGYKNNVDQ